jgi:lysophospholipase L1-like esterase
VLVELGLRIPGVAPAVYAPRRFEPRGVPFTQVTSGSVGFPVYPPNVSFASVYDPAGDRRGYLEPGGRVSYRINAYGLRGRPVVATRPAGGLRVLCLGDSLTFGEGVLEQDAYPARLERLLAASMPGRPVEVINAGVQGYGTREEVAWYFLRGASLRPDVVTLGFFLNDATDYAETIRENDARHRALDLPAGARVSRIWEVLARRARARSVQEEFLRRTRESFRSSSWELCRELLRTMRDQARESRFRFIVLILPVLWELDGEYPLEDIHGQIAAACREDGCECLDLLEALRGRPAESLWVHPTDQHPNELAHRLIAERLAGVLATTGE